jgi:hypothetical protein
VTTRHTVLNTESGYRGRPGVLFAAYSLSVAIALVLAVVAALVPATFAGEFSAQARPTHTAPAQPPASARSLQLPANLDIPVYTPGRIPFHDGERLRYRVSWLGIPAADADVRLHRDHADGDGWTAEVWIRTNKLTDALFRMRDYMREDFSSTSLASRDIYIRQHEKRRRAEYRVTFDHRAGVVTAVKRGRRGVVTRRFTGGNPWGPFSGAMMALSQPLEIGRTLRFDVFSGNNRYVFDFKVTGRQHLSTPVGEFDAFRIEPSVVYLTDGKMREQARESTIWISDDGRSTPLRMESSVFIGKIRIDLVQLQDGALSLPDKSQAGRP